MKTYIMYFIIIISLILNLFVFSVCGNNGLYSIQIERDEQKKIIENIGIGGIDIDDLTKKTISKKSKKKLEEIGLIKYHWTFYKQFYYPVKPYISFVTCEYGYMGYEHAGIDIRSIDDLRVYAVAKGKVIEIGYKNQKGKYIRIEHKIDGKLYRTSYCHLSYIDCKEGDIVESLQKIGIMGCTGEKRWCTGIHVHFSIQEYENGKWLSRNPLGNSLRGDWLDTRYYNDW